MRCLHPALITAFLLLLSPLARAEDAACGCQAKDQKTELEASSIAKDLIAGKSVELSQVIVAGTRLDLSNQTIRGNFSLRNSIVCVPVKFSFATFQGVVELSGTCFAAEVKANDANFQKYWVANRATFQGALDAHKVAVAEGISFGHAKFEKNASFTRTRIGGSSNFWKAHFAGEASFLGATILGQAPFQGAVFGKGANFERVAIAETAFFREQPSDEGFVNAAEFHGIANFKAATIGGQANFVGVKFHGEVRMTALRAEEAYFWSAQFYTAKGKDANDVYFNDAQIGMLDFGGNERLMVLHPGRMLNLNGLTYKRINTPPQDALNLFERLGIYYNRQPYKVLETYYRDTGSVSRADDIYFARRVAEADRISILGEAPRTTPHGQVEPRKPAEPGRWLWDRVLRYSIGYGVEWRYPAFWFGAVILLATILLSLRGAVERNVPPEVAEHPVPAARPLPLGKRVPIAFWLALSLVIPKLNLPGADRWSITENRVGNSKLTYWQASRGFKWAAWVITTVALSVFGLTDLIKD